MRFLLSILLRPFLRPIPFFGPFSIVIFLLTLVIIPLLLLGIIGAFLLPVVAPEFYQTVIVPYLNIENYF